MNEAAERSLTPGVVGPNWLSLSRFLGPEPVQKVVMVFVVGDSGLSDKAAAGRLQPAVQDKAKTRKGEVVQSINVTLLVREPGYSLFPLCSPVASRSMAVGVVRSSLLLSLGDLSEAALLSFSSMMGNEAVCCTPFLRL